MYHAHHHIHWMATVQNELIALLDIRRGHFPGIRPSRRSVVGFGTIVLAARSPEAIR
jgi:hypothetical protein